MDRLYNLYSKITNNRTSHLLFFCLLMLVFTAMMMFFYSPLCPGGDFYVHFNRFIFLMDALRDGSFPTYMDYHILDGYGYLIKAFYCDFVLIPFAWLGNLTSALIGYQSMIFTMTFLCGLFTYIALRRITENGFASLIGGLLYSFSAYRIIDIYIRGALGESLSFTFLPIILLGAYELLFGNYRKWYILTIGMSLMVFSHLISSVLSSFVLAIFLVMYSKRLVKEPKRFMYLVLSAAACLIVTAYYLYPMLEQMASNTFYYQTSKFTDVMVSLRINEVLSGILNMVTMRYETLAPRIGPLLVFILFTRVFIKEKSKTLRFFDLSVLIGSIFLVMSMDIFPWHIYPFKLLEVVQFSWRLFEYTSFLFAIAAGYYLSRIILSERKQLITIASIFVLYALIFYTDSIHYFEFSCRSNPVELKQNASYSAIVGAEYLPSKVPPTSYNNFDLNVGNKWIEERGKIIKSENESTIISNFYKNKGHITFDVDIANQEQLELPLTYYIGYEATIDGESIKYQQSEFGLIELPINKSGKVEINYVGTKLQTVCWYITLISILLLMVYIYFENRKQTTKK